MTTGTPMTHVDIPIRRRIVVRLFIPALLLVVSMLGVISVLIWYSYRADVESADRVPVEIVEEVHERVEAFFRLQELNLTLASKSVFGGIITDKEQRFLTDILKQDASIIEIVLLSQTGTELYRTTESTTAPLIDTAAPQVRTSVTTVTSERHSDMTAPLESPYKTPFVIWTFPVFDNQGSLAGTLSAAIDISTFWQYTADAAQDRYDAHVYIADQDGVILVSNKSLSHRDIRERTRDILFQIGASDIVERYYGILGPRVAGKAHELLPTMWSVVAEVPLRNLMQASERNLMILGGILLFIVLLTFYAIYAFQHQLTRPLRTLLRGAAQLSSGNYQTRITLGAHNELTQLADLLNTMAASIETQTSEIVSRLKRTIADLDRSAKALMKRDEDLSKANERLEKLDHAKSEFVSIAAHQLRTPLSALKWAQQMLLEGEAGQISEPQRTLLMQSQESVRRMVTLVNDLLSADHLEYGKVTYNFKQVESEGIISDAVHEVLPIATERSLTINHEQSRENGMLSADPERLKEAFLNILSNAIKYTPNGGTITIRTLYGMGKVVYTFADTGIGIPESERSRLFEKFVRMENAKKVDANGSGLGLFIVKKIIDAHSGRIWFDSVEGRGTTFFVELPLSAMLGARNY